MTLIVQTIAGLSNADSYVSQADFETYCENRNRALTDAAGAAHSDEAIEAALRAATQYIDTKWRYKAITLVDGQSTEFPRDGLTDWNGRAVTGVPRRVADACCELAFAALSEELYQNLDRGGLVAGESVGPISVSYFANAPAGKVFAAAAQLLAPYTRSTQDSFPPSIGGVAGQPSTAEPATELTPIFTIGMHANNGS